MIRKLDMKSKNLVEVNVKKISENFPGCIVEYINGDGEVAYAIDFDALKTELGEIALDSKESRYQFTWPEKRQSVINANVPSYCTLRPIVDKSKGFDSTENIYIEGDNLEVLKVLQESYLEKIKLIYIDPPYNTGHDFLYNDDYKETVDGYLRETDYYDDLGNRLVQNMDTNGRFHTSWLNMIYPRLKLARNLLSPDGVILISIDDNEVANLKKCCDEIFGEHNFIAQCSVQKSTNGMGDKKGFAKNHEFILCYQKSNETEFRGLSPSKEYLELFDKEDEHGKYKIDGILMKKGVGSRREDSPTLYFPLYYSASTGEVSLEYKEGFIERYPYKSDGTDGRWTWGKEKIKKENYRLYASPNGTIYIKDYLTNDRRMKIKTILDNVDYLNDKATNEVKSIFGKKIFDTPKPVALIKDLCDLVTEKDDIIMDFFAGSATTAQAILELNSLDGGRRRFIMVQLPELLDTSTDAYKSGFANICEIGEERIRIVGKQYESMGVDTGFRVLRLDSSNMKDVYYNPASTQQTLMDFLSDNIKEDRTPEDLFFQVMLDLGVLLSSKIQETEIAGKKVFSAADDFLIACFDTNVTDETVKAIALKKPYYAVFRDSSMVNDSVATNFEQIFNAISPETVRKVL